MRYTFVTVAYLPDLPFLKLQARSLNRYLDHRMVDRVIVVDNTSGSGALPQDELLPQFGSLPVTIIRGGDLSPLLPRTWGWMSQQIYKLLIARHISTERYVVLDAKNHLILPFRAEMIEAPDGRIRTGHHDYSRHPLLRYLVQCCSYQNVNVKRIMDYFLPTTPPFTFKTSIVRQLVADVEKREKARFADVFFTKKLTEFFLYGAYIVAKEGNVNRHYDMDIWLGEALWEHYSNAAMRRIIAETTRPFFAVHRRTFRLMDDATRHALAKFWHERHLFMKYENALRFVNGCAVTYGPL